MSTQNGDLVTEHQDLDVFGCAGAGEERQPARHTGERSGAGKAKFEAVKVTKPVDLASPALFQALATGAHFLVMKLFVRRAGATTPSDYAIYQFNLVYITNIDVSGDGGDDTLQETVEMTYGALQTSYTPMTATGTLGKQQTATWNQVTNTNTLDMPAT